MKRITKTMIFGFVILAVIMPVFAYNLDEDFPSVFAYQKRFNDYMGYSVLLYADPNSNKSWLLIGSPKSNHGPKGEEYGAVHRCPLHDDDSDCTFIQPNIISNEDGFIAQVKSKALIRKDHGWLGSTMSVQRSTGILTVCAPRTLVSIFDSVEVTELETMHGVCYTSPISSDVLYLEDKNFATYDFAKRFWYNPLHGFSIHYARTRNTVNNKTNEVNRIIGEPAHDIYGTVEVKHSSTARISVDLSTTDELSMFGYSVTAGYFFKEDQLLYAAGAPGWQYVGQVGIIDPTGNGTIVAKLRGTDVGEFFGGSLTAGDVDNDGLDDLIVGAPHFGNDNGKIYVFLGTVKGTFDIVASVPGAAESGYFGYTLACGDLDADGFADIIVGAPWEGQGVVYVFNGGSDIKEKGSLEPSQRLSPTRNSLENRLSQVQTFGFSLSEPVDIDANGYPDIAVGAYKSEHAIIFYSKPVVKTQLRMQFVPGILGRNVREFIVKVCAEYHNYNMHIAQDFKITLTLDEQHRRTKELQLVLQSSEFTDSCLYSNITVLERVEDFIEPITVLAKHEFLDPIRIAFCKTCPIESRHSTMNTVQGSLPFDIGCGVDNVCTANVSVAITFNGVQDKNNTWIIGSNDISLCIILENHGEPAYLTTIMLALPEKIILRSILTSCQEDESGGSPVVICDAGNPLGQGEKKAINIDLDMRHLNNGSLHGNKLSFTMGVNTRSVNQGTTKIEKVLNLVSEVSLSLNGKANEENYYLSLIDEGIANVSFQHVYQIFKLGMTPIEAARLIVRVPTSAIGLDSLISVHKPQLILSGKAYQCTTTSDIVLLEAEGNDAGGKLVADVSTLTSIHPMQNTTRIPSEIVNKKLRKSQDPKYYLSVMLEEMQSLYRANDFGTRDARIDALYSSDILYFNCSSPHVNCSTIVCDLTAFRTLLDVGTVHMMFTLDTSKLNDVLTEDTEILKFSVDVYAEILQPQRCAAIDEARSRMDVATIFYIPRAGKVQLWIILLSVSVGLLFLLIIAAVLTTTGFFKRSQKEKLSALKNTEVSEMDNKETGDSSQAEDT